MEKPTKEELEDLILIKKLPYTHLSRIYGVADVTIKKWAVNYGINVPNRKVSLKGQTSKCPNCGKDFNTKKDGRGGFIECCSQECASALKATRGYEAYLQENSIADGKRNMQTFKKYFLEDQHHKCDICGMEDVWQDKPITFILDHIDGNADNNNRENLRLVCPNCDSQLDTYKSKNKNSARAKYRKT